MKRKRVLVVDDEPAVCGVVASMLHRAGYEPNHALSVDHAIELLNTQPDYDLVMADVTLKDGDGLHLEGVTLDGLDLLDALCAHDPTLPVVMFTALKDVHVAASAFRRGAVDYLLKPAEHEILEQAIVRALEIGHVRRQELAYKRELEERAREHTGRLEAIMQDLERSYDITLEAMGDALDLRDAETEGHSKRVTAYTIALAREMGVGPDELKTIARGAFLHDIGKIATPDRVLLKPAKLDPEEIVIMRQHCQRGYEMVRKIPFLSEASEIVYAHQESFDGTGYPRGLSGDQIPLGARIFAIADTLDAMTSDRPYRNGATVQAATAEIARCAGTQFDPAIVDVFLAVPITRWQDLRAVMVGISPAQETAILCRPEPTSDPAAEPERLCAA